MEMGLSLGEFEDQDKSMLLWLRQILSEEDPDLRSYEEGLRKRLYDYLSENSPEIEPLILQEEKKTGLYRFSDQVNDFLGPEMAKWCNFDDQSCTPPIKISVMCDMSDPISCQTISRAVRKSEKLFLLYPYISTKDQQNSFPEFTIMYGKFPNQMHQHSMRFSKGGEVLGNFIKFDLSGHTGQHGNFFETPEDIMSAPLYDVESVMKSIHENLGIMN